MRVSSRISLLAVLVLVLGLLLVLWSRPGGRRGDAAAVPRVPGTAVEDAALSSSARATDPGSSRSVVLEAPEDFGREPGAELPHTRTLAGHFSIGGRTSAGHLTLTQVGGDWTGRMAIGSDGRFRLDEVPRARLAMEFEPFPDPRAPRNHRQLLLPELEPDAGEGAERLELDFQPKHVNVRVLGKYEGAFRARVHVEGPHTHATVETDEEGKAYLTLVEEGRYVFRLDQAGRVGDAELELGEGQSLETVLILSEPGR